MTGGLVGIPYRSRKPRIKEGRAAMAEEERFSTEVVDAAEAGMDPDGLQRL